MGRIKVVLAAVTLMVAMVVVISGSASAQEIGDCEFVGFDSFGNAVFVCDVDFDGIDDRFDDFIDLDFDGIDDRFFGGVGQSIGQEADSGELDVSFDVS